MMVSVHLPKTAGTSFRATLEENFGTRLKKDYEDLPLHKGNYERNLASIEAATKSYMINLDDVACIHGHFLPVKYLLLRDRAAMIFVTWMRHPVDRVVSHYEFWKREYNESTAGPLHRKVVVEGWSLRDFCLSEEIRNLYDKFLWAFPIEYFNFIGIVEFYEIDHAYFVKNYLNVNTAAERRNAAPSRNHLAELDSGFRREIEAFHGADIKLYNTALAIRDKRVAGDASTVPSI
jgi:hypothetical protein